MERSFRVILFMSLTVVLGGCEVVAGILRLATLPIEVGGILFPSEPEPPPPSRPIESLKIYVRYKSTEPGAHFFFEGGDYGELPLKFIYSFGQDPGDSSRLIRPQWPDAYYSSSVERYLYGPARIEHIDLTCTCVALPPLSIRWRDGSRNEFVPIVSFEMPKTEPAVVYGQQVAFDKETGRAVQADVTNEGCRDRCSGKGLNG